MSKRAFPSCRSQLSVNMTLSEKFLGLACPFPTPSPASPSHGLCSLQPASLSAVPVIPISVLGDLSPFDSKPCPGQRALRLLYHCLCAPISGGNWVSPVPVKCFALMRCLGKVLGWRHKRGRREVGEGERAAMWQRGG
jgi:hypothetical protein